MIQFSVGSSWVEGLHLDTADSLTFDGSDLDVSLVSPGSTPRVSDDVVLFSSLGSVSDGGNGVIEVGSTSSGVQDSGGVLLEDSSVGLNGHGNWLLVDGSLKLGNRVGWHVSVRCNTDFTFAGIEFAGSGLSGSRSVWVISLELLEF